jgi:uncharacterized protein YigE (DUF2233 family)
MHLQTMKTCLLIMIIACAKLSAPAQEKYIYYIADPLKEDIRFFWKTDHTAYRSIGTLKSTMEKNNHSLIFAMNGGMYDKNNAPQGLYIENQKLLSPLNTSNGKGNFYMKPNGVFYITTENKAVICNSTELHNTKNIKYATQSGPLLLINGNIHLSFNKDSKNKNIRNGVGILPDQKIIFAMSTCEISFYEFADFFKQLGCKNAVYLDGYVSRTYLPEKNWIQTDGDFGVMIGIIK